jgi:hypothetical protein
LENIMTSPSLQRVIAFGAIAASAFTFGVRAAAADDAATTYEKDYEAIEVKATCEGGAPDAATMTRIAGYVATQTNFSLSAGQTLTAMEQAKHDARELTKGSGCKSDASKQMVALYHQLDSAAH